jgi:hypothetical protein
MPDCLTATIPPLAPVGLAAGVTFSNDVKGTLDVQAGGVRVLWFFWTVHDINPADPRNSYTVDVVDAGGMSTGHLAGAVTYVESMPNGVGCGDVWTAGLSD